jgi:hypothetical protein
LQHASKKEHWRKPFSYYAAPPLAATVPQRGRGSRAMMGNRKYPAITNGGATAAGAKARIAGAPKNVIAIQFRIYTGTKKGFVVKNFFSGRMMQQFTKIVGAFLNCVK